MFKTAFEGFLAAVLMNHDHIVKVCFRTDLLDFCLQLFNIIELFLFASAPYPQAHGLYH